MKQFHAKVEIKLKPEVLDPQGKTVLSALHNLGFEEVVQTRVGKLIDIVLNADTEEAAKTKVEQMSKKLLANPVIEDFSIEISEIKKS